MEKNLILKTALLVLVALAILVIMPLTGIQGINETALALTAADCITCHTANMTDRHHLVVQTKGVQCALCHAVIWVPVTKSYTVQVIKDCTVCHGSLAHEAAHDHAKIDSTTCQQCHQANVVTEHANRNLGCNVCHSSTVQKVIDAIKKGREPSGQDVYCYDCHGVTDHATVHNKIKYAYPDPYNLITSGCTACHSPVVLAEHSTYNVSCAACHNYSPYKEIIANAVSINSPAVTCVECHDGVDHSKTAHDTTKIIFPTVPNITCTSTSCHATDAVTEHDKNNVDCYDCHTNNNLTKNNTNLTYQQVISNALKTTPNTPVSCTDCHGSTPDHAAAHTPIPTTDTCASCHGGYLVTVHASRGCNVCHNPTYQPVIDQGKITPLTSCSNTSCHSNPASIIANHEAKHTLISTTTDTCAKCHGESLVTVHAQHPQKCNVCHNATYQSVITAGTTSCSNTLCHVGVNHTAAHDYKVVIPYTDCGSCHATNVVTIHKNYPQGCLLCHNATYQAVMSKSIVYCADCHSSIRNFGNHVAQHDKAFIPAGVCTDPSYATNVVTYHESISTSTNQIYCFRCHTSTNSAVMSAINSGMAGSSVSCSNCHPGRCAPNQPPVAEAGPNQTAQTGQSVSFSGAASKDPDGTIVSYAWNFGDGSTGTGVTTSHTYTTAGTYTVTLTVTDNNGATGTDTAIVTVTSLANTNLALKKSTSASGSESGYGSSNAVDGNMTTRWWKKSTSEQWIRVDLGSSMSISTVILKWHSYYAKDYYIETSTDGSNWYNVKSVSGSDGGTDQNTFSSKTARYVRVRCRVAYDSNGYSLYEFEVYK